MSRAALLALLFSLPAFAMGPLEKNDDDTAKGTAAFEDGKWDEAVQSFDAAAKKHPRDARAQYNRGLALHKAGKNDEARQAFERAKELDTDGKLAAKIHYNLGNVSVAQGDKRAAVKEYRQALRANPDDALARHNLEVLLRDLPPPPQTGQDGGMPDGGKGDGGSADSGVDGGRDGGADAGRPDGGHGDGGSGDGGSQSGDAGMDGGSDGGQGDAGQGDGGQGDGGQGQKDQAGDGGDSQDSQGGDAGIDGGMEQRDAGQPGEMEANARQSDGGMGLTKEEADKLLDSMKSGEKNLQLWRFRQKSKKSDSNGKDW